MPTPMAEIQKNTGSHGVYHRSFSLPGVISQSEPRDDWCMVESRMPTITSGRVSLWAICQARFQRSRSKSAGLNSNASTVV